MARVGVTINNRGSVRDNTSTMTRLTSLPKLALLTTAIVAAIPSTAGAQSMGVKGGVQFSTVRVHGATAPDTSRRADVLGGVFYVFGSRRVMGQLEGLAGRKGARTSSNGVRTDDKILYFEIPMLLRVNAFQTSTRSVFVSGGGALAARWAAKAVTGGVSTDTRDVTNRYDLEAIVAGGFTARRLIVEGRYTRGMLNVDPAKDAPLKVTNDSIAITAGYLF